MPMEPVCEEEDVREEDARGRGRYQKRKLWAWVGEVPADIPEQSEEYERGGRGEAGPTKF